MKARRHIRQWPSRLGTELNGASGVAGFGGTIAGLGGAALSVAGPGTFAAAMPIGIGVAVVGGVVALGAFGRAFYRSIPEKLLPVETQLGKELPLTALDDIYPPIPKLTVFGGTKAGKTTLKHAIPNLPVEFDRTQNVSAFIIPLTMNPIQYVAVLDGAGEEDPQQYLIAEPADMICVVFDHNESDAKNIVDNTRLEKQTELLKQLRNHFDLHRSEPVPRMHFLLNKRDLGKPLINNRRPNCERSSAMSWRCGNTVDGRLKSHSLNIPTRYQTTSQNLSTS